MTVSNKFQTIIFAAGCAWRRVASNRWRSIIRRISLRTISPRRSTACWTPRRCAGRNDATLYAVHFDGTDLNSLGAAKLDWMLKDDSALPLAIWIAIPPDDQSSDRQTSVTTYLKDHGLKPEQIKFNSGPNPHTNYPAASADHDAANSDFGASGGTTLGASSSSSSSSSSGSH